MRNGLKLGLVALGLFVLLAPTSVFAKTNWTLDPGKGVTSLSLSADGSKLAVGSYDTHAYVFDQEGKKLTDIAANNVVTGVTVIGNEKLLVSSDDRRLYAYDLNGNLLWESNLKKRVEGVSASADGSVAAVTVQNSPDLLLIDTASGEAKGKTNIGFRVQDAAVASNGKYIAVGGKDQNAYLLDEQGKLLYKAGMDGTISSVAVTGEGELVVGLTTPKVIVLNAKGEVERTIDVQDAVKDVAVASDGRTIGAADYAGNFYVISDKGKVLWKIRVNAPATRVVFDAKAVNLYGGTEDGQIYRYDVESAVKGAASAARNAQYVNVAIAAGVLIAAAALFLVLKKYNRLSVFRRIWKAKWIYVALFPAFFLLIGFLYVPAISGLYHSLYDWHPGGRSSYVGLANFRRMLTDEYVTKGIGNLAILIVTGLIKAIVPPLVVAELIYHLKSKRLQYYFRTAFVSSMVIPVVAMLLIWQNLYDPNLGLINHFLDAIGLESLKHSWLGDSKTAIWSVIFIGFPFVGILQLLVLYSGLLGISEELIEAAKMDGAKFMRIVRSIHLPLLSGQFKFLIILTLIGVIQDFNAILIVTGGGPMDSTYVPALQMYYAATKFDQLGYASALGVSMFFVILLITVINMKFLRSSRE
ncbi:ABC transporter permease subunit [Cohnella soli]|uniref:ABC transporter permease subunit n=1 Tax=Cohnella soli TaxID=425005 RepID=A0ABW0HQN5_9BACL